MEWLFFGVDDKWVQLEIEEVLKKGEAELLVNARLCYVRGIEVDPAFDLIMVPKDGTHYSVAFHVLLR